MGKVDPRTIIEDWQRKRDLMPIKEFVLSFNLSNGEKINVKVTGKDEIDIRSWVDRQGQRIDVNKNNFNNAVSIYRDYVIWIDIKEKTE